MNPILDFTDPIAVLLFTITLSGIVFLRYVFASGIFYLLFYIFFKEKYWHRKISERLRPEKQHWKEIKWSVITSVIFGLSGTGLLFLWQNGYSQIYTDISDYGILYFFISLGIALFLHESYYYWLHRWMHRPKIYRLVHKVHHNSIVTSPWTSFSFHPLESILQALVVPVIVLFLPIHFVALSLLLIIMTVSAAINHLDIEIYPEGGEQHWLWKWIIGATHHSLHHSQFRFNFGLYFTFWDKWMNTESPDFKALFRKKTQK
jgi:sterol desaturase/sphingolipid hydroxylase (fatty acid hydroxylase superfamily)